MGIIGETYLPIASLALVLALSGCSSDKYYDLGFKIGQSSYFEENWTYFKKMNPFFGDSLKKSFDQICEEFFDKINIFEEKKNRKIKEKDPGPLRGYVRLAGAPIRVGHCDLVEVG